MLNDETLAMRDLPRRLGERAADTLDAFPVVEAALGVAAEDPDEPEDTVFEPFPLCEACGGAAIAPDGSECPACEGFGLVMWDDEGPDEGEDG